MVCKSVPAPPLGPKLPRGAVGAHPSAVLTSSSRLAPESCHLPAPTATELGFTAAKQAAELWWWPGETQRASVCAKGCVGAGCAGGTSAGAEFCALCWCQVHGSVLWSAPGTAPKHRPFVLCWGQRSPHALADVAPGDAVGGHQDGLRCDWMILQVLSNLNFL